MQLTILTHDKALTNALRTVLDAAGVGDGHASSGLRGVKMQCEMQFVERNLGEWLDEQERAARPALRVVMAETHVNDVAEDFTITGAAQWPDVLMLDAAALEAGAFEVLEGLTRRQPRLSILLLSDDGSAPHLLAAMRAGVREVLTLPLNPVDLHAALARAQARGAGHAPPSHHGKVYGFTACRGGSGATTAATSAVALNQSSGITLEDATVVPGYWSVTGGGGGELQSLPATPAAGDAPAMLVTVRRADGENGGPLPLQFARFLGITSMPVAAIAVAAVAPPGAVGEGVLFPLAVSACLYRNFWDATTHPPGPKNDPGTGQPYVFRIGPGYTYGSCTPGTWTSFGTDAGSAAALQALMDSRNPALLKTGGLVWTQITADDSLYQSADACSARGTGECATVIVPVVENVAAHAQDSITGFACLRLALAESSGGNYVQAVMSRHCKTRNVGGIGPDYGALTTARLVR